MSTLTVRPVTRADMAELVRMRRAMFPDENDHEGEIDQFFGGQYAPYEILVAERETGGLAGFVEVGSRVYAEGCTTSPVGYIEAWYVDADVRRLGVGRVLIAAAEDWARKQSFREIASDALIDNHVSVAAHTALGYREIERIVCFIRPLFEDTNS